MKRFIAAAAALAALGGLVATAHADEGAIKYRQSVMKAVGGHVGAMGSILKGEGGEMADFQAHASAIAGLAEIAAGIFPEGSDKMAGDTQAKMEIWEKPDEFKKVVAAFQERAKALEAAAEGGDKGKMAEALGALGKNACKACHDDFREKKKS